MDELDSQPRSDSTRHEYNDGSSTKPPSESQQSILPGKHSQEGDHRTPFNSSQPTDHVTASDAIPDLIMPEDYADLLAGLGEDEMNDFDGVDDFGDEMMNADSGTSRQMSQEEKAVNDDGLSDGQQVNVSL